MFDLGSFVDDCHAALAERDSRVAIKQLLEAAVADPDALAAALPGDRWATTPVHLSPELTIMKVIWAPGISIRPHNHLMWVAIGIYAGQENNVFYQRSGEGIVVSGTKDLRVGEVALMGAETIHAVTNPLPEHAGAIHVYGGHLPSVVGRSEWDEHTLEEMPFDMSRTTRNFVATD